MRATSRRTSVSSPACGGRCQDVLTALAELEPERSGFCLPMFDEVAKSCVALGTAGSKGCQLHPFGCAVPVDAGGLLDGLAPLGESPLNIARDGRDPERIILPLKPNALTLQPRGKSLAVSRAGFLLRLVELSAYDRSPTSVAARGEVEDEGVGVELWIGFAAGVVIELRHEEPRRPLPCTAAPATSGPARGRFEMRGRRQHRRAMGLLDRLPVMPLGESP